MKKYFFTVRETITRHWEVTMDAEDSAQVERWWYEGNIPLEEGNRCELADEEHDAEITHVIEIPAKTLTSSGS